MDQFKKVCFLDSFGSSITEEIATILAAMSTHTDKHTILHITKSTFYDKKNSV